MCARRPAHRSPYIGTRPPPTSSPDRARWRADWPLYRYNPKLIEESENPFSLDSKRIKASLAAYLQNENRYASLRRTDASRADHLQGAFAASTIKRMESMQRRAMDEAELLDALKAKVGEATGDKVMILYASETGNTADLAKMLAYELKRRDQRVSVMAMDDLDVMDLPSQKVIINLAATCGQGEFPANSRSFKAQLSDETLPPDFLDGVRFATFAMGDSGYVFYNSVGQVRQLASHRLVPPPLPASSCRQDLVTPRLLCIAVFSQPLRRARRIADPRHWDGRRPRRGQVGDSLGGLGAVAVR